MNKCFVYFLIFKHALVFFMLYIVLSLSIPKFIILSTYIL